MPLIDQPLYRSGPDSAPAMILPIILHNPHNNFFLHTDGQIDTGADESAIPEWVAKKLGHDIRNKRVKREDVVTGSGLDTAYLHTFRIEIFGFDPTGTPSFKNKFTTITERRLGVMTNLNRVLLGVNDFLIERQLIVDYPKGIFSLI